MKKLLFLFLAIVLSACSAVGQSEVETNRQQWQDANISHYQFQLSVGCFCIYRAEMPVTVEVQDGKVVSMTNADGQLVAETDPLAEFVRKYATIDGIFTELNSEDVKNADQVTVTYDPTYGFPVDASIDFNQDMAAEELSLNVSNFEILP